MYSKDSKTIRRTKLQLRRDIKVDLYCNRTLLFQLCENIMSITQTIYNPSHIFSLFSTTAQFLCTDDTENGTTKEGLTIGEKAIARFKHPIRQFSPTQFKGHHVVRNDKPIKLSQKTYNDKMTIDNLNMNFKPNQR